MLRLQNSPAGLAAVVLRAHFTTTLLPSANRFCRAKSSTGVPCRSVTISMTRRALLIEKLAHFAYTEGSICLDSRQSQSAGGYDRRKSRGCFVCPADM